MEKTEPEPVRQAPGDAAVGPASARSRPAVKAAAARARHIALVTAACRSIEASDAPPDLAGLAARAGLSRFHFHRLFKQVTGLAPGAYARARRAERMQAQLAAGARVTDAIYAAGFASSSRFYASAQQNIGMPARSFRAGGEGQAIRFAVAHCALGALLVAASDQGVCAIEMGDDAEALVQSLQQRFARAELIGADARFEQWVARIIGFIDAPGMGLELPLDLRGTAFQRRVWQALRGIPVGETLSYAQLADRIGMPRAVRAVARACATNPVALAVPCHRVVRTDGALSGYRWGIERKRALLDREQDALRDAHAGARAQESSQPPEKSKSKSMSSGTGTS
jgi:AraC family transcriptional regulator of adaptative response/methylated-DNA-[protein]-cysteine methyltransferase